MIKIDLPVADLEGACGACAPLKSSSLCLYSSNLGTFWLKIELFWQFEEISIFSHGVHLGYRTALTDTILKGDHPRIISAKFG